MWMRFSVDSGASIFFHALDLLQLALRLGGFARLGAEAIGKFLELLNLGLLIFVSGELDLLPLRFLLHVGIVVAAVAMHLRVANLKDIVDQLVQERAIVRDHQDRAGIIHQVILKPAERFEIEVIGRLIEHEEIGLHHQQAREVGRA